MVYRVFTHILSMSLTASVVILAIVLVRCVMGRFPKKYSYLLWLIVGIRLVCPFGIASPVSVFNITGQEMSPFTNVNEEGYTVDTDSREVAQTSPDYHLSGTHSSETSQRVSDTGQVETSADTYTAGNVPDSPDDASKWQTGEGTGTDRQTQENLVIKYGMIVWIIGMVVLLLWNLYGTFRLKKHLAKAVKYEENIYECDAIPSPFVMGLIRPRVYIPFRLGVEERKYILKHEQYHIKRRDYVVKLLAFLLTAVYWFHPLVWLSYFLMIRDMEMSCDEYVLQHMDTDIRRSYSKSLLGFATNQRGLTAGVLAFGETNTRRRVRNVMNFKKHGKWIGLVAIVVVVIAATVCLTNANGKAEKEEKQSETGQNPFVVSETKINDYQLKLVYMPEGEVPVKDSFGMYEGAFELQTYQKDKKCASLEVQFPQVQTLYYPAERFNLVVKDYDGDGSMNDFSLGQGQTGHPALGNYMVYQLYSVDEDGSIIQYALSAEDEQSIVVLPGDYSRNFDSKDGEIFYDNLEGVEQSRTLLRVIPVESMSKDKQPEQRLVRAVESTMPQKVVDEIQEKGVWRLTKGTYSLANSVSNDNITLRLDFSYTGNVLTQYVSKEYGFVDAMPKELIRFEEARELIRSFASAFLDEDIDVLDLREDVVTTDDKGGKIVTFSDVSGNSFTVALSKNMVVRYDASEERVKELKKSKINTVSDTGKSWYLESIRTTVDLPESDSWIQEPITGKEGEDFCEVSYHDGIADTDVTLRLWKGEKDISYVPLVKNRIASQYWSAICGSEEIKIKIERGTFATGEDEGVVLSWKYQDLTCAMFARLPSEAFARLPSEADYSSLTKAAAYVTEGWYRASGK